MLSYSHMTIWANQSWLALGLNLDGLRSRKFGMVLVMKPLYINLNRHEFILFGTNPCHFGVNQYQSGMESYHQTMESGVKNVSKKFSELLDDGMWNIFFNICIISWAIAQKVWKSLFDSSNLVWIYTRIVWFHSSLVLFHACLLVV